MSFEVGGFVLIKQSTVGLSLSLCVCYEGDVIARNLTATVTISNVRGDLKKRLKLL